MGRGERTVYGFLQKIKNILQQFAGCELRIKHTQMKIKILGTGCTKCNKLEKLVKEAIKELSVEAHVEKVEDIYKIMQLGVMQTPGLVIDDEVVLTGRLPKKKELLELISK